MCRRIWKTAFWSGANANRLVFAGAVFRAAVFRALGRWPPARALQSAGALFCREADFLCRSVSFFASIGGAPGSAGGRQEAEKREEESRADPLSLVVRLRCRLSPEPLFRFDPRSISGTTEHAPFLMLMRPRSLRLIMEVLRGKRVTSWLVQRQFSQGSSRMGKPPCIHLGSYIVRKIGRRCAPLCLVCYRQWADASA